MHEMGASIPNECIVAMSCTFLSENLPGQYQIPSYTAWYYRQDLGYAYSYYRRMLKVLQWKNPRRHWLLKAPTHWQLAGAVSHLCRCPCGHHSP